MIYQITGKLTDLNEEGVVLVTAGIGYFISLPPSFLQQLPALDQTLTLYTYHHIREDAQLLFGFFSLDQKQFFLKLIGVSGVGPKVALKIISELPIASFRAAILSNNIATLTRISGVGKKMAERLIVELKDALTDSSNPIPSSSQSFLSTSYTHDIQLALKALGYSKDEIVKALEKTAQKIDETKPIQAGIKHVLGYI